jgi:hypothetical protein
VRQPLIIDPKKFDEITQKKLNMHADTIRVKQVINETEKDDMNEL